MQEIISVVVPICDAEDYVEKCLNNILNQSFKDLEVICVDGSTKHSDILNKFSQKDERIKILSIPLHEQSCAKNAGLNAVRGKYVCFVNVTDHISADCLQILYDGIKDGTVDFVYSSDDNISINIDDEKDKIFRVPCLQNSIGGMLFKKEIIDKYNIRFPKDFEYENEYWQLLYLASCENYFNIAKSVYQCNSGIPNEPQKTYPDITEVHCLIAQKLHKEGLFNKYAKELQSYFRKISTQMIVSSGIENYSIVKQKIENYLKIPGFSEDFYQAIREDIDYNVPISIIVPVYNTSPYLRQCLDSILNQTCRLHEVICVDDGSIDNSLEILRQYEKIFSQIKVIASVNCGASTARNKGIEAAKGKYIMFVDSDDFVEANMVEKLYLRMQNDFLDWIVFQTQLFDDQESKFIHSKFFSLPNDFSDYQIFEKKGNFSKLSRLPHECWNKVFRHKIIQDNKIRFLPMLVFGEDNIFNFNYLEKAKRCGVLKEHFYNYRCARGGSLTYTITDPFRVLPTMNVLGEIAATQTDAEAARVAAFKYINEYLRYILKFPIPKNKEKYNQLRSLLKKNKFILLKYKSINPKVTKDARKIVKYDYIRFMLRKFIKDTANRITFSAKRRKK